METEHLPPGPERSKQVKRFLILIGSVAGLGGLLYGFDTGVISGAQLQINTQFGLSTVGTGVLVSSVLVGAFLGSLFAGPLGDHYGRKRSNILAALLFIVGLLIAVFAVDFAMLLIGRIVLGVGIGITAVLVPTYIVEIAPSKHRGTMTILYQLALTFGILAADIVDWALDSLPQGWRWMFAVGLIPAVIVLVVLFFMPRSPRWLLMKGNEEEARRVLHMVRHHPDHVDLEVAEISESIRLDLIEDSSWRDLFKKSLRPILTFAIIFALIDQLTGVNAIIYYAPTILQKAGFASANSALGANIIVGAVNFLATFFAVWAIDRIGRRPMMLGGLSLMIVGMVGMAAIFEIGLDGGATTWLAVIALCVYLAGFANSMPLIFVVVPEIFPSSVRSHAMGLVLMVVWAVNLAVAQGFPTMLDSLGGANTFWVFGAICVASLIYMIFKMPETKGVELEDIQQKVFHTAA